MTEYVSLAELDTEDATVKVGADGGDRGPNAGPLDAAAPEASIQLPADATQEEIDAIAAAVREHLRTHGTSTEGTDEGPEWVFAGRLRCAGTRTPENRHLREAHSDPWVAAGRAVR